ncbi:MAG: cation diffusion facilitator family transporter [Candidatus Omnitrophota bacterium]|nr:cation diffusion facilitator family transporter [Candidatus Omnitrophota bacterium]
MGLESNIRYKTIRNVLIVILALNWIVALAKIIYGIISRSSSITADGFHSLSDGASNIIGIIGVSIASQPKDFDHPYGHKKYETFFSLGIAALLILVSFNLLREGIERIAKPIVPDIDIVSFLIMVITIMVNFLVMTYENRKGKALKSDILISDSMHTRADIFTSFSVIVALIAVKMGYPIMDPVATIVISLFIAKSSFNIIKESGRVLCDTAAIVDTKKITDIVLNTQGVKTCHNIRTRGREDDIYIDLHIQVHSRMHIDQAHKISCKIEEEIKKNVHGVTDVVVHVEPLEGHSEEL